MLPNPTMPFLLIALAIGGIASAEDWTIVKDSGAYRVNGCKLTADGRLVSASGTTRVLSRQQLDEIGAAIDRYESGHTSAYASPAVAGPVTRSSEEGSEPMSGAPPRSTPGIERRETVQDEHPPTEQEVASTNGWRPSYMREGVIIVLFVFGLNGLLVKPPAIKKISALLIIVILGYWIIAYLIPVILCAIFLVLLGPLSMLSRLRKK